jgi:HAD superfamily hydrolase (TIGR01509 family)
MLALCLHNGALKGALSPRAVLFDMDGVLVDSEPIHVEAMHAVLDPFGVAYTDEENEAFFGFTDLEVFAVLRTRHALAPTAEELTRLRTEILVRMMRERSTPMAGVPDVLLALRAGGYRLALASGSAPVVIEATLAALGVGHLFEVVVSGVEVGKGKPAPDVFLEAARRLGIAPAACVVVEDSRNGLLAARAAGMACAVVPCPATRHQDFREATHRLAVLPELLPLLLSAPRS